MDPQILALLTILAVALLVSLPMLRMWKYERMLKVLRRVYHGRGVIGEALSHLDRDAKLRRLQKVRLGLWR